MLPGPCGRARAAILPVPLAASAAHIAVPADLYRHSQSGACVEPSAVLRSAGSLPDTHFQNTCPHPLLYASPTYPILPYRYANPPSTTYLNRSSKPIPRCTPAQHNPALPRARLHGAPQASPTGSRQLRPHQPSPTPACCRLPSHPDTDLRLVSPATPIPCARAAHPITVAGGRCPAIPCAKLVGTLCARRRASRLSIPGDWP